MLRMRGVPAVAQNRVTQNRVTDNWSVVLAG